MAANPGMPFQAFVARGMLLNLAGPIDLPAVAAAHVWVGQLPARES